MLIALRETLSKNPDKASSEQTQLKRERERERERERDGGGGGGGKIRKTCPRSLPTQEASHGDQERLS